MDYKKMFKLVEVPKGYIIKKYKAKDTVVVVPDTIDDKKVVAIDDIAFMNKQIEEIVITENVIAIGERAFCECKYLKKVTLGSKVTIGRFAFYGCESLADENGFIIVGGVLFDYLGKETNVHIPDGVRIVDDSAFERVKKTLEAVELPNSVEELRCNAFYKCRKLRTVTMNSERINLEASSFEDCDSLVDDDGFIIFDDLLCAYRDEKAEKVYIPGRVKRISKGALESARNLKEVIISEGVETIDKYAFFFAGFEVMHIPESVKSIGEKAFVGCSKLRITAPHGSYAIEYAIQNNIPFEEI